MVAACVSTLVDIAKSKLFHAVRSNSGSDGFPVSGACSLSRGFVADGAHFLPAIVQPKHEGSKLGLRFRDWRVQGPECAVLTGGARIRLGSGIGGRQRRRPKIPPFSRCLAELALRLQFVNHNMPLLSYDVVLLPPLSKKNLGRETLSPALFCVLRRTSSPRWQSWRAVCRQNGQTSNLTQLSAAEDGD